MGYRGKTTERERARELRAAGWTYAEICAELDVSRSSVSLWARDVPVDETTWAERAEANRRAGARLRRHPFADRRRQEIERLMDEGRARIGRLSERELLAAGAALYAGEGSKRDGEVRFANSDPRMILFFVAWLRHFFEIDESRLRIRLYLHEGLDLIEAQRFWSSLTSIPERQFHKPYRAVADVSRRQAKHPLGCPSIVYGCASTHRGIMGLVNALLTCEALPG
jgi:transcriptional regulator with XRE-family HTH domain